MLESLREALHVLGNVLLWPVLGGLLLLLGATCVTAGQVAREWVVRRNGKAPAVARFQARLDEMPTAGDPAMRPVEIERLLQSADSGEWRRVGRIRQAVRLGPALGLMGTLIPMASALQGLAAGDVAALAGNLVTAFSATVVGLAISVVAFLLSFVREGWVRNDALQRAYHAERALLVAGAPA